MPSWCSAMVDQYLHLNAQQNAINAIRGTIIGCTGLHLTLVFFRMEDVLANRLCKKESLPKLNVDYLAGWCSNVGAPQYL